MSALCSPKLTLSRTVTPSASARARVSPPALSEKDAWRPASDVSLSAQMVRNPCAGIVVSAALSAGIRHLVGIRNPRLQKSRRNRQQQSLSEYSHLAFSDICEWRRTRTVVTCSPR